MTHNDTETCAEASPQRTLGRRIEVVARASAITLLFVFIVALPAGLTYVELAFAS